MQCITSNSWRHQSFVYIVKCKISSISKNSIQHKFYSLSIKQFYLTHCRDPIRVDQWVIAMKGCSTFSNAPPLLVRCHQIFSSISGTLVAVCVCGGLTPLQRRSWCILQSQSTGPSWMEIRFRYRNCTM